jgi:hypothetical protein
MAKRKLSQEQVDAEALKIVGDEKKKWETAVAYITERVAFQMRYLIRQLRKNYWGVFDSPSDPSTGRQKTWVPLTRAFVENVVKSIDLDTKDINFIAKKPEGYAITDITRAAVRDYLDKDNFGEKLDVLERDLCIDGTVIWKTYEDKASGKCKTKQIDLLNAYIDPTENSIQEAYRFTERSWMLPTEYTQMSGWRNTDIEEVKGSKSLARIDSQYRTISAGTTADYRDTWEMWGKIPKSLITKDKDDEQFEVDGHIVLSGLETGGTQVHLIEENETGIKPYEEVRYAKVNNRWYGVGIAETLMWLQIWLNTIMNIRINRSYVTQLGLYKIRQGSGITPAMLSRLSANGAILVKDLDDIAPLETPSGDNSSYQDERVISDWAQKTTGAYDIAVGNETAASSTATANMLQNTNAKSAFTLVKETVGMFLERWLDRHALPIIAKSIAKGDVIHFAKDDSQFKDVVQSVIATQAMKQLEEFEKSGFVPTEEVLLRELKTAEEKVMKKGGFFAEVVDEIIAEQLLTKVLVTNEKFDPSVTVNNLIQTIPLAPEFKDAAIKEIYDLMGLSQPKATPQPTMQGPMQAPQNPGQPATAQSISSNANIPQRQQVGGQAGPMQGGMSGMIQR